VCAAPERCIRLGPDAAAAQINTEDIPYLNKIREKARQKKLAVQKEAWAVAQKLATENRRSGTTCRVSIPAWRSHAATRAEKAKQPKSAETGPRKRKGRHEQLMEEWEELAREERLYKKMRKGKISRKRYAAEIGEEDDGAADSK
jgi:ATP-dependent RNA helicase DDX55/SPB4